MKNTIGKTIIVLAGVIVPLAVLAQYSINWSTIDGGGGTMSGGDYAVRGTIGQPDAANMDGGDFLVHGGFWVPAAVQMEGAPWLYIVAEGSTNVVVSWSPDDLGWILQETFSLMTNWVDSASGTTNPVTIPATEAAMFYRLHREERAMFIRSGIRHAVYFWACEYRGVSGS